MGDMDDTDANTEAASAVKFSLQRLLTPVLSIFEKKHVIESNRGLYYHKN